MQCHKQGGQPWNVGLLKKKALGGAHTHKNAFLGNVTESWGLPLYEKRRFAYNNGRLIVRHQPPVFFFCVCVQRVGEAS